MMKSSTNLDRSDFPTAIWNAWHILDRSRCQGL